MADINQCGSFWFWFMRPIAEFAGAVTMVTAICTAVFVLLWVLNHCSGRRHK